MDTDRLIDANEERELFATLSKDAMRAQPGIQARLARERLVRTSNPDLPKPTPVAAERGLLVQVLVGRPGESLPRQESEPKQVRVGRSPTLAMSRPRYSFATGSKLISPSRI